MIRLSLAKASRPTGTKNEDAGFHFLLPLGLARQDAVDAFFRENRDSLKTREGPLGRSPLGLLSGAVGALQGLWHRLR